MNKLKKVFFSFVAFFSGLVSTVSADYLNSTYEVVGKESQAKYGVAEPTLIEKMPNVWEFAFLVIIFIIGLFVILNKELTKKVKIIVVSFLVILALLGYMFMNYIETI